MANLNSDFPYLSTPFVNPNGTLTEPWYLLLVQLWRRTGSGEGTPSGGDTINNYITNEFIEAVGGSVNADEAQQIAARMGYELDALVAQAQMAARIESLEQQLSLAQAQIAAASSMLEQQLTAAQAQISAAVQQTQQLLMEAEVTRAQARPLTETVTEMTMGRGV